MTGKRPEPPRLARRLVGWLLPASEREYALGDLEEIWTAELSRRGRWGARRWYWSQAFASIVPLLTMERVIPEGAMLNGLGKDVFGGFRQFGRSPLFAAIVVLTVAIGVGGATAVYSVLHGIVMKPLSFPDSERVVTLWGKSSEYERAPLTVGDYNALADNLDSFETVAAEWGNTALLMGDGDIGAEQVAVGWVTPQYFRVLRTVPHLGRLLGPDDANAILIDHGTWLRRYGGDTGVIGRTVDLSGDRMQIVGVLRAGDDPNLTAFSGGRATNQIWRLQPPDWTRGEDRSVGWLRASGRLSDGVALAQAQAEVDALMVSINQTVTNRDGGDDLMVDVKPARADLVGDVSRTLWTLLAAVCGVLLIAATNVANLMLGRGQGRTGEVALRTALGGSRLRIIRQLTVESAVLGVAGGVLGIGLAWLGMKALVFLAPPSLPRIGDIALDGGVLIFALVATMAAVVLFGLVPAIRASRTDLTSTMGRRTSTGGRSEQRLSRGLVIAEVALSLCLLVSTGLLLRSLQGLGREDLGFTRHGLLTFALEAPNLGGASAQEAAARIRDYTDRVREEAGVIAVGVTNRVPLGGGLLTGEYRSEQMAAAEEERLTASYRRVTPEYFAALDARFAEGRSFTDADGRETVIIDRQIADRLWPGEDAVGKRLEHTAIGEDPVLARVIGVVAPMKHASVSDEAPPTVFLPMLAAANQLNFRYMMVRVAGDPLAAVERIRDALRRVDPNTVMARIRPMTDLYDNSVASTRFAGQLLALFAILASLLAAIGLHGVMTLLVRRRTREFGIRVALGAGHDAILKKIFGSGVGMVAAGTLIGIALSLGIARTLSSLLYGIGPTDLVSIASATGVIMIVGMVSAYLPARHVNRVDPAAALRTEGL